MKKLTFRTIIAVAFCLTGIIAAVLTFIRFQDRSTIQSRPPIADADVGAQSAGFVGIDDVGVQSLVAMTSEAISRRVKEALLPDGDEITADAGMILQAWLGGTGDDYLAYLEATGDPPPPAPVWDDEEQRNKAWLNSTKELREASFDPDGVSIRASFINGEPNPDEATRNSVTGWRLDKISSFDEASPSAVQLKAAAVEMYEVRIPMRASGFLKKTDFIGQLVLSYTRDPVSSRWALVAVSIYDVPLGDTARTPPF